MVLDYGEPYQSPDRSLTEAADSEERSYDEDLVINLEVSQQTAIHLAIVNHHEEVVEAVIQHKGTHCGDVVEWCTALLRAADSSYSVLKDVVYFGIYAVMYGAVVYYSAVQECTGM